MKFLALLASVAVITFAVPFEVNLARYTQPEGAELIPDEYIVTLKKPNTFHGHDYSQYVRKHIEEVLGDNLISRGSLMHTYQLGYAAVLTKHQLAKLRQNQDVDLIEQNSVVTVNDVQENPSSWGLKRIDQRELPLNNSYEYSSSAGEGVDVYVVDTGVFCDHVDFEGRCVWGATIPKNDPDEDGNGHGTHVSSTIAGKKYGVCKKCKVIAVKVLRSSGYGSMADVLKGVEWVAEDHLMKSKKNKNVRSVANMSLGGSKSPTLDRVVDNAVKSGVLFAVAAGNSNVDACKSSPAASKSAVTVGASTKDDERAYFSNYGKCVDLFAPGHMITGAWIGSKTAEKTISGTSMASPHVAAVLALLAHDHPDMSPEELKSHLLSVATKNALSDIGEDSPNLLLYSDPKGHSASDDQAVMDYGWGNEFSFDSDNLRHEQMVMF
ncbi:hypothetical protein MP638_004061 [Amoeboaphelidium occidentale]|nr:hypothetical protein MP638_004061 [Amoeboaphelidium occidentale]